jgi:hypothetical protein
LHIVADADLLTVDDMIALEDGKVRGIRDVLARLAVDDQNKSLPFEDAKALVGRLSLRQLREHGESLGRALRDSAVTPRSGGA